jgi:hypothetical protein
MNPDPEVLGYPIDRLPQCGLKQLKVGIGKEDGISKSGMMYTKDEEMKGPNNQTRSELSSGLGRNAGWVAWVEPL